MVCDIDTMFSCILAFMYCSQGLPQGSSLENKSVSEANVIRGKSVKEELN